MVPKLYMMDASPSVRAVLMISQALNIELENVEVNLRKKEHLSEEFLKLNPLHTVPTLVDNGHCISDSHAINLYLIEKYGKETPLYPPDIYKRADINQRLFFDAEVLFHLVKSIIAPLCNQLRTDIPEDLIARAEEVYTFLETFLENGKYMAGDEVTLADITFIASVTSLDIMVPMNKKYTKLDNWMTRVKSLPFYLINVQGLANLKTIFYETMGRTP